MSPLRIAIDGRKINDFGIGTYLRNLIRLLPRLDTVNEFHVLCYRQDEDLLRSFSSACRPVFVGAQNYSLSEHWAIPLALKRIRADLFHSPHYVLPFVTPCPAVVTVHDVIHLLFPQYLPSRFATHYARYMIGRALSHAKLVMTVSNASKRDLLGFFDIDGDKIRVIPNGIDPALTRELEPEAIERIRRRFQLTGRNALFVGNIKPHKNVERLIDAFARLREDPAFSDLTLIVVGEEISKYPALRRAVERHNLRACVRFFGFVPEMTLVGLYRAADIFVFPSLYEGFGLPPLEAMANGTPVVTSRISSLPEVVGDAAITVDPYDIDEIAHAMKSILTDGSLRNRLIEAGHAQAQRFSWESAVAQIHAAYMSALGKN
ncbi:MAG TPA: glycosyltransferase family 1 protein [Vicinamibacteria bacterium]|nr:glycosyltransferase family 1 protein [Vicinamibacteria bacterium]